MFQLGNTDPTLPTQLQLLLLEVHREGGKEIPVSLFISGPSKII